MKPNVTYQKVWDGNETSRDGRNGRIYEAVVGWVYEVRVGGEYVDNFKRLRDAKRAYPDARLRKADD